MKAFIIGAAGFVGRHLADQMLSLGWSVGASKMPQETIKKEGVSVYNIDILDPASIRAALEEFAPDYIVHLAAQSSVALSWKNPSLTIDVNIKGAANVLETVRALQKKPRLLLVGSGEQYGHVRKGECPVGEENPMRPGNIYAATKACQDMLGKIYADAYDMDVMITRAFNHIGPGQQPMFAVASFCRQVAEIEAGLSQPVLRVGNLSAQRDFTDVRDVVRAYTLLLEKGRAGEVYNVGSGKAIAISNILEKIISLSHAQIRIEVDPERLRPVDIPLIEADIQKLVRDTGWHPVVPLEQTLQDTLSYWRSAVKNA